MTQHLVGSAVTGQPQPPMPGRVGAWAIYETFETADEQRIFIGLTSDNHWRRYCKKFNRQDLLNDPNLKTNEDRVRARDVTLPIVAEITKRHNLAEMEKICEEIEIPFSPVARPEDLTDDPQLNADSRMLEIELDNAPLTKVPRLPVEIGDHDLNLRRQPPKIGEHTREILAELGYDESDIGRMNDAGTIVTR